MKKKIINILLSIIEIIAGILCIIVIASSKNEASKIVPAILAIILILVGIFGIIMSVKKK